jgi:hypothetical protein
MCAALWKTSYGLRWMKTNWALGKSWSSSLDSQVAGNNVYLTRDVCTGDLRRRRRSLPKRTVSLRRKKRKESVQVCNWLGDAVSKENSDRYSGWAMREAHVPTSCCMKTRGMYGLTPAESDCRELEKKQTHICSKLVLLRDIKV